MYGYLVLRQGVKGRRCALGGGRVLGMALVRAEVPVPPGLRERALLRRVRKAGERLWEQGVNRVLTAEDFPPALWEPLGRAGLAPVEVEALCREEAEPLVLALLAARNIPPRGAVVCLSGGYALGAVQNAAEALARRVGRIVIDCPGRGEELARWLSREYGLPQIEPGTVRPDVTAAFSPERGEGADLRLYGREPDLGGLRLLPAGRALPEGYAPLPLLAALRECGCLGRDELLAVGQDGPEPGTEG